MDGVVVFIVRGNYLLSTLHVLLDAEAFEPEMLAF